MFGYFLVFVRKQLERVEFEDPRRFAQFPLAHARQFLGRAEAAGGAPAATGEGDEHGPRAFIVTANRHPRSPVALVVRVGEDEEYRASCGHGESVSGRSFRLAGVGLRV